MNPTPTELRDFPQFMAPTEDATDDDHASRPLAPVRGRDRVPITGTDANTDLMLSTDSTIHEDYGMATTTLAKAKATKATAVRAEPPAAIGDRMREEKRAAALGRARAAAAAVVRRYWPAAERAALVALPEPRTPGRDDSSVVELYDWAAAPPADIAAGADPLHDLLVAARRYADALAPAGPRSVGVIITLADGAPPVQLQA